MAHLEISVDDYWKSTLKSAEATLALLLALEGRNVQGVDNAIISLRDLIAGGNDFSQVQQQLQQNQQQQQQQQTPPENIKKVYNYSSYYDMENDWHQVNSSTIEVPLKNNKIATCVGVSTEKQVDEALKEITQASYIAVDCEFQAYKDSLPELKLIQIGVSSTKGFAFQVDVIGVDVLSQKLKPILEDNHINIVGWSYRSDGLAIESFFKSIQPAPVLDLQAKLLPIALETLNLEAAMVKFANQWDGFEAFRKAKNYSDNFRYNGENCVWLKNPLPPKALVYAVFDVLSVHALHEYTTQYPTEEKFYWPFTLTNNQSDKAIHRLHQQRAIGIASPAGSSTKSPSLSIRPTHGKTLWNNNYRSTSPTYRQKDKQRQQSQQQPDEEEIQYARMSPQLQTDDGYDDNDDRFQKDMQTALELSLKESKAKTNNAYGSESSQNASSSCRQDNVIVDDLDEYNRNSSNPAFGEVDQEKTSVSQADYPSWGEYDPTSHPFFGSKSSFTIPQSSTPENSGWDYDPSNVEPSTPVQIAAPIPVRQPIPPPSMVSPQFQQQKPVKVRQYQFSRSPHTPYQNKPNIYQQASVASPALPYQQQQPPTQQPPQHLPKPVAYTPRNSYNATRSPRKTYNTSFHPPSSPPTPAHPTSPVVASSSSTSSISKNNNNNNHNSSKSPVVSTSTAGFKNKPSKEKYTSDFQNRIVVGDQSGAFTWSQDSDKGTGAASWASFASSTNNKWKNKIDSEMSDWEKAQAKQKEEAALSPAKKGSVKFNTMVGSNLANDASLGNNSTDGWTKQEERPDTMTMRMNQIPIRTSFSGPRMQHPDDGDSETDDDYTDNDDDDDEAYGFNANGGLKLSLTQPQVSQRQKILEGLPTFVDAIYPYSFNPNEGLSMFTLTKFEHLNEIYIPEEPFTVTIGYHTMDSKSNGMILKALQLYFSTGESYTCMLEKACEIRNQSKFQSTLFGRLLTDPKIKRVSWYPKYIETQFMRMLGFTMGSTIDLAVKMMHEDRSYKLSEAVEKYLKEWPDVEQYFELKEEYDNITSNNSKKFAGSCWDRQKLPEEVLKYCAIQGLTVYTLYQKSIEMGIEDEDDFIYPSDDTYDA